MGLSRETRILTLLVIDTTFFFIEIISGYAVGSLVSRLSSLPPLVLFLFCALVLRCVGLDLGGLVRIRCGGVVGWDGVGVGVGLAPSIDA